MAGWWDRFGPRSTGIPDMVLPRQKGVLGNIDGYSAILRSSLSNIVVHRPPHHHVHHDHVHHDHPRLQGWVVKV